jgi:DNA-binding NtrC family response regulator
MSKSRVLIIDDEPAAAEHLRRQLAEWGYDAIVETNSLIALERTTKIRPAVIITDIQIPKLDGVGLLRNAKERVPEAAVILITDHGSAEIARRAIQEEGAFHYLEKPVDMSQLQLVVERACEFSRARLENEILRRQLSDRGAFGELVGSSEKMREIYSLIEQVAWSNVSVLITGESGTGKEMVARTIHNLSPRKSAPFVAINCSAIPETLMESELFGHERGAFTGAASQRQGCFELAHGGTLLLDEIADMPSLLQSKLLRTLEERSVRRLGGKKETPVDVRMISATNKNPHEAIAAGQFREDLLYRLNVISIDMPPLRERMEDLPLLAQHLVAQLADKHGKPARWVTPGAVDVLASHSWPGNIRELRNVLERAVIICSGDQIERRHLAPYPIDQRTRTRTGDTITFPIGTPIEEIERQMILHTLRKTDNNKTRTAELLGISQKTLHNKLNLYRERGQIAVDGFRKK